MKRDVWICRSKVRYDDVYLASMKEPPTSVYECAVCTGYHRTSHPHRGDSRLVFVAIGNRLDKDEE